MPTRPQSLTLTSCIRELPCLLLSATLSSELVLMGTGTSLCSQLPSTAATQVPQGAAPPRRFARRPRAARARQEQEPAYDRSQQTHLAATRLYPARTAVRILVVLLPACASAPSALQPYISFPFLRMHSLSSSSMLSTSEAVISQSRTSNVGGCCDCDVCMCEDFVQEQFIHRVQTRSG